MVTVVNGQADMTAVYPDYYSNVFHIFIGQQNWISLTRKANQRRQDLSNVMTVFYLMHSITSEYSVIMQRNG